MGASYFASAFVMYNINYIRFCNTYRYDTLQAKLIQAKKENSHEKIIF